MNQFISILSEYGLYLGVPLAFLAIVAWVYRPSAKSATKPMETSPSLGIREMIEHGRSVIDKLPYVN